MNQLYPAITLPSDPYPSAPYRPDLSMILWGFLLALEIIIGLAYADLPGPASNEIDAQAGAQIEVTF